MVSKNQHTSHILQLNVAMVLMSTSGALGRLIEMPPPLTIWWRCLLAGIFLLLYCLWKNVKLSIPHKGDLVGIFIGGLLLGGHWITYFFALQYSTVAIGMLSLFTYPVITAFLEPIILKTKFHLSHIVLALLVLMGIYLIAPEFNFENDYTKGIAFGLSSAFLYSLRNVLLKNKTKHYQGSALMLFQLIVVTIVLLPSLYFFDPTRIASQWPAVVTLALVTTAVGHTLFVVSFKHFSVSTASIVSSSQPIYGILLGAFFLNEVPDLKTIFGGILILTTVLIESVRSFRA